MNFNVVYDRWLESDKLTISEKVILKNFSEKEIEDSFYKELESARRERNRKLSFILRFFRIL